MSERRQLSEQSRRYNAMIADAVMRAEAEGEKVIPMSWVGPNTSGCRCPLGALLGTEQYPDAVTAASGMVSWGFAHDFIAGFEAPDYLEVANSDGCYLGRLYRARALRMHGGGE